jgi:hypothetical protein
MRPTLSYAALLIALALVVSACEREEETVDERDEVEEEVDEQQEEVVQEEEVDLHPIWGDWDPADDLEAVQGEWVTVWGPDEEVQTRWSIDGDQAVHHRSADDEEPQEGTLSFDHPGAMTLTVEIDGGTTGTVSSYAREGDDIYVGLGMGGVVLDDRMVLRHGRNLLVYHDDGRCLSHSPQMFDGFDEEGVEAECEIVEEDDQRYLTFVDPERDSAITIDQRIEIGDESLTDIQLRGSKLHPPAD